MSEGYAAFLDGKRHLGGQHGYDIEESDLSPALYPFQRALVARALRKGRAAIFADCGLGKTPMQLEWAGRMADHARKPILIATPLAVGHQLLLEAEKFGVDGVVRSADGSASGRIVVTNYERLHRFCPGDFAGMVCDESSILKNFDGQRRALITEFMRRLPYRLLCTATAAPNDYVELGTSSEALGEMGYTDMLGRFFKNDQHTIKPMVYRHRGQNFRQLDERAKWRFKGHAEVPFWRWVATWARAVRKPSDLGFDDAGFTLPPLTQHEHAVHPRSPRPGFLFDLPAVGLQEEREERRRTVGERCEMVAALVHDSDQALVWCHLNAEGDRLAELIPGAVQVSGSDAEADKESRLIAFARGEVRVLVTKPKIGAWGLNLQRCAHVTFFPSHSYEQYYQGVRRCWRFGQTRPVRVDIVATEGEAGVMANLQRKATQADRMFSALIAHMSQATRVPVVQASATQEVPSWLSAINC